MSKKIFAVILLFILSLCPTAGCGTQKSKTSSYEINCTLEGDTLCGEETVRFYNFTDNAFTELKFNLFGNAFRKSAKYQPISAQYKSRAYYDGESYGCMDILSVKAGEAPLEYSVCGEDENVLSVELSDGVYPGESACVTIKYKLKLAKVIARTGINQKTVNLANFYPILCGIENGAFYECVYYSNGDPFFSDCADYKVTLTADENYTVAASGRAVSSSGGRGVRSTLYEAENVRSFAFVLSENFQSVCDSSSGTEITYYYYDDQTPEYSLNTAVTALKLFGGKFGAYPYNTYSVVQTEFIQGGMEFPSLVMIGGDLEQSAYREVIVHETAHQWWQTAVGSNEVEYPFLDEGLAEYSVVMFYEANPQYGFTREQAVGAAEKTFKTFCTVYDKLFGKVDTSMIRSLGKYSGEYEYVNISYVKPTIMYDMFRTGVGDALFEKGLKRYYDENKFRNAVPDDLVAAFERSGADAQGFFGGFFDGKEIL